MAIEPKRGCGYRKIGGLYLVSGRGGLPCDRLPFPLDVCPTCHAGFKQTRGWTWVEPMPLLGGIHRPCDDRRFTLCPVCNPVGIDRVGLLWVGEKFYPTTRDFSREAAELGISRRIKVIPHNFELGKTWVLLAHPKAIYECTLNMEEKHHPGIFKAWLPSRIEKILPVSKVVSQERDELEKKGITCVFVPDNDPDHQGSVHEDETDTQLELATQ